ncbi:MAG: flavodoxin family protein [Deltaproteobacteria bacterium]|nr:flavodoxin family protein [Deltaproteobacteria bacterium]
MAKKLVAIVGSYRREGIIHQAVEGVLRQTRESGHEIEIERIDLLDRQVKFCTNCRVCTQAAGEQPGLCILQDDMAGIIAAMAKADYLVLAAPVNCFNVTALFRCFLERLICFAYWPWGRRSPRVRSKRKDKRALLISSSAMPGPLQPFLSGAPRALKAAADLLGARTVAVLRLGGVAVRKKERLSPKVQERIKRSTAKLLL